MINCTLSPICDSYNYRPSDKTCQLNTHDTPLIANSADIVSDNAWTWWSPIFCNVVWTTQNVIRITMLARTSLQSIVMPCCQEWLTNICSYSTSLNIVMHKSYSVLLRLHKSYIAIFNWCYIIFFKFCFFFLQVVCIRLRILCERELHRVSALDSERHTLYISTDAVVVPPTRLYTVSDKQTELSASRQPARATVCHQLSHLQRHLRF